MFWSVGNGSGLFLIASGLSDLRMGTLRWIYLSISYFCLPLLFSGFLCFGVSGLIGGNGMGMEMELGLEDLGFSEHGCEVAEDTL